MEKKRRTSLSGGARWLPASVTLVEGESGVLESGVSYATDLLHSLSAVRSKTATVYILLKHHAFGLSKGKEKVRAKVKVKPRWALPVSATPPESYCCDAGVCEMHITQVARIC